MCLEKGVLEFEWDSEKEGLVSAVTPQCGYGFLE